MKIYFRPLDTMDLLDKNDDLANQIKRMERDHEEVSFYSEKHL